MRWFKVLLLTGTWILSIPSKSSNALHPPPFREETRKCLGQVSMKTQLTFWCYWCVYRTQSNGRTYQ